MIALTKTDFYPGWRTIRDLNQGHLDAVNFADALRIEPEMGGLLWHRRIGRQFPAFAIAHGDGPEDGIVHLHRDEL